MPPKSVEDVQQTNGKAPTTDLTSDEKQWLAGLLSHQQVCSVLTSQQDKAFAANIQAKLLDNHTAPRNP